ncbi:hypothetical protein ILUMI_15603, partial [Ignelater luminosus]
QDDPCTTPYGYKGKCIQLPSCLILLEKINPTNATTTRFAQDSLCGWEGIVPLVCCELIFKESPNSSTTEDVITAFNDFDTKSLPDWSLCGLHSIDETADEKILGGEEAQIAEFPWVVALEYTSGSGVQVDCGGSLINQRFILTAAHCVVDTL